MLTPLPVDASVSGSTSGSDAINTAGGAVQPTTTQDQKLKERVDLAVTAEWIRNGLAQSVMGQDASGRFVGGDGRLLGMWREGSHEWSESMKEAVESKERELLEELRVDGRWKYTGMRREEGGEG